MWLTRAAGGLAVLFGHGDDDHPLWLLAIRANVLLLVVALLVVAGRLARLRPGTVRRHGHELLAAGACTLVALAFRLFAASNLLDQGGIPYSRMLLGYRGYFATAQAYSLVYFVEGRDLEHAILLNRLAGIATVPLVFVLCRRLRPRSILFPTIAAGLLALCPLHILFSASAALSIFSGFLCALTFVLLATDGAACFVAGLLALALLTQVRYENVLLVVPPVVLLALRGQRLKAAVCAVAGLAYAWPSVAAGISFQDHTALIDGWRRVGSSEVLFNPFLGIPLLFGGALLVALARRPGLLLGALLPWLVAGALTVATAESPQHATHAFSNWLVPIVVAAGYGFSLLAERGIGARIATAMVLAYVAIKPVRYASALSTRYLEMAEHEAFEAMLAAEPPGVTAVIVPDDERMRRRMGATIETMNKYSSVRRGLAKPGAPLVGITDFLAGHAGACKAGGCLFFAGLPCTVESINTFAPPQCQAMGREHRLEPVASTTVTGAPFERCAIYVGRMRESICSVTERTVALTLYRVDGVGAPP